MSDVQYWHYTRRKEDGMAGKKVTKGPALVKEKPVDKHPGEIRVLVLVNGRRRVLRWVKK